MNWRAYSLKRYRKRVLPILLLVVLTSGAARVCKVDMSGLGKGLVAGLSFFGGMFPPDWSAFTEMLKPAFDSVIIALLGTFLGTVLSLFFGLAAASNISPRWLRATCRFLIGTERSLPEIIILLILVAAMGLGPFVGVLSLTIGCIGMLGKLFADTIEEIDPISIESIEALGAGKLQVIAFGVIQPIIPSIISFALFRFELNIRLSIVLGAVGAGGIGYELYRAFSLLDYRKACTALIITLVMVFITERLSASLRKKVKMEGSLR
ncbi:MAG: phosphonate ABC transporter, permease protein PhnE [Puia sp.]|nr:phosphonate ABC transporter, permease protein PhnE [Puia sp.]